MGNIVQNVEKVISKIDNSIKALEIQSSESYELAGTVAGGYDLLELQGNTVQNGTPTPSNPIPIMNTFDCVEMMQGYYHRLSNGEYVSTSDIVCNKNHIPCKSGDVIKISYEKATKIQMLFYGASGYLNVSQSEENVTETSYTAPANATYCNFNIEESGITPSTLGKIQLTINGKYVGVARTHGKNLVKVDAKTTTTNGITFTVNEDGSVGVSGTQTSGYVNLDIAKLNVKAGESYTFSGVNGGSDSTYRMYVLTTNSTFGGSGFSLTDGELTKNATVDDTIILRLQAVTSGNTINTTVYPMIRRADIEDDTYEPYTETIAHFLTNEPIRLGDKLFKENGLFKVERNIKSVFSNNITWLSTIGGVYGDSYNIAYHTANDAKVSGEIYCDAFVGYSWDGAKYQNGIVINENKCICLCDNVLFDTQEKALQYVNSNVFEIQYKLAAPIIETLDADSQRALRNLETFDGVTYIEVDSRVQPAGIKGEYGISKLATDIIANKKSIYELEDRVTDIETHEPIVVSDAYEIPGTVAGGYRLLEMQGNTEQKTLTGKNLLSYSELGTSTLNGVTFTPVYDANGLLQYINVNGTATATTTYTTYFTALANCEYILNGCPDNGSGTTYQIDMITTDNRAWAATDFGIGTVIPIFTEDTKFDVRIRIGSGTVLSNLKFYPMIRLSSIEDDTYEPYLGGVELVQGCWNTSSGVFGTGEQFIGSKGLIPCEVGDTLKLTVGFETSWMAFVYFKDGAFVSSNYLYSITELEHTVPSDVDSFAIDIVDTVNGITPDTVGTVSLTVNGKPIYVHAGAYTGGMTSPSPYYPQAIKNVSDCVEMIQGYYDTTTGKYGSANDVICSKNLIPCKAGYNIAVDYDNDNADRMAIFYYGESGFIMALEPHSIAPSGATHFAFRIGLPGGITPQTAGKIQLTINGKYVGCAKTRGKNFLKNTFTSQTIDTLTLTTNSDGTITANGMPTSMATVDITGYFDLPPGEYIATIGVQGSSSTFRGMIYKDGLLLEQVYSQKTFTVEESGHMYMFFLRVAGGYTANNLVFKPMIRRVDITDDTYEPYKETVAHFLTTYPLMQGSTLYKEDGLHKVEHGRAETIFNGSESWSYSADVGDGIYRFESTALINVVSTTDIFNVMSDKFTVGSDGAYKCRFNADGDLLMWVPGDVLSEVSASAFKTWLTNNPTTVQYPLATPTIETLDTDSQLALNGLETFDGITYIEVDSVVKPAGIKGEYGTTKIGGYTLKGLNNSETYLAALATSTETASVEEPAVVSEEEEVTTE